MRAKSALLYVVPLLFLLVGCATPRVSRSWQGKEMPIERALKQILRDSHQRVSVAILGTVDTPYSKAAFAAIGIDLDEWKRSIYMQVTGSIEQLCTDAGRDYKNFKVVDRNYTQALLAEQKFSLSGAVTPETSTQLGKMLGVTHLIIFHFLRNPAERSFSRQGFMDTYVSELVDAETGEVLASQTVTYRK
jgi:curli biogenesis system outer membrane secretion channel CsgG